ncbi:hypothetical protein QNI16_13795 [Cytophagaceae bacterium YF14B1]|uniref:Uncharacterized protein n=1 Tax=Xanthocytophaga flava TaxID=3048013 RepID=A0AAE3QLL1_9BACT|nr:hypothetical protein [Xanthocytophaga flavus]MDJ1481567.1 hypothetical protein [Xanthocytophaga flavus]
MDKLEQTILEINTFVRKDLWQDFKVSAFEYGSLKIVGGIDLSSNHTIEITFIATSFMEINYTWMTDTSKDMLMLASDEENLYLNAKYQIEEGYTLFKIIPEYFEEQEDFGFFVAAKDISFKTEKVYYFPSKSDTDL